MNSFLHVFFMRLATLLISSVYASLILSIPQTDNQYLHQNLTDQADPNNSHLAAKMGLAALGIGAAIVGVGYKLSQPSEIIVYETLSSLYPVKMRFTTENIAKHYIDLEHLDTETAELLNQSCARSSNTRNVHVICRRKLNTSKNNALNLAILGHLSRCWINLYVSGNHRDKLLTADDLSGIVDNLPVKLRKLSLIGKLSDEASTALADSILRKISIITKSFELTGSVNLTNRAILENVLNTLKVTDIREFTYSDNDHFNDQIDTDKRLFTLFRDFIRSNPVNLKNLRLNLGLSPQYLARLCEPLTRYNWYLKYLDLAGNLPLEDARQLSSLNRAVRGNNVLVEVSVKVRSADIIKSVSNFDRRIKIIVQDTKK